MKRAKFLVVILAAFICGCTYHEISPSNSGGLNPEQEAMAKMEIFYHCMSSAAANYAASSATPSEAAEAASASCGTEFEQYRLAVNAHIKSVTGGRNPQRYREKSNAFAQETLGNAKQMVIKKVLDIRISSRVNP